MVSRGDAWCVQTTYGETPLYIASREGHQAVAKLLLDHGAVVNQAVRRIEAQRPLGCAWVVGEGRHAGMEG